MGRPRKIPDPWQPGQGPETLEDGSQVVIWTNAATQERRLVPVGLHPSQQPLADPDPDDEDDEEEDTPEARMFALMQEARALGVVLRLYRVERGGKLAWLEDYSASEWEEGGERMVREVFGPGDYEVRFWQKGVRSPLKGKLTFNIAGPRITTAPPAAPTTDPNLTQLLASIAEGQRTMLAALTERPPPADPAQEMSKMLGLMVTMRQALGMDAQPRSNIGEIVSAIRELREASDEIAPRENGDSLMGQLPRVLEVVQQGMAAQQQQPPVAIGPIAPIAVPPSLIPPPAPPPPPPAITPPPPPLQVVAPIESSEPKETEVFNPLVLLQLKAYLKTLISYAAKDAPKPKAAQFVYDKLPDEIVELLALDNWWDLLVEVAPEVKPYQSYLTEVREQALALFEDGEEDPEEPKAA